MNMKNTTLRRQLNGVIVLILVISFIGSVLINAINTQSFLNEQLTAHAQDTATSLGLSLSDALDNGDTIVVNATIDAIFDRGYYQHIILTDIDDQILYQRTYDTPSQQVPSWFMALFSLAAPEQKSMIDTGWVVSGILKVQSHTGLAYQQLWESSLDMAYYTLFVCVIALLLAYLFLIKIYRPINAISEQATALQNRQFNNIVEIPRALELRNFVLAMNKMVDNIKRSFDELTQAAAETHSAAYVDPHTGIANRRAFNDALDALLADSAQHNGFIAMVRISGLATLNQQQGYQAGDNLVAQLSAEINGAIAKQADASLFRISGSEFCLLLDNFQLPVIEVLLPAITQQISHHIDAAHKVNIAVGCSQFTSAAQSAEVMYEVDMATNLAIELDKDFYIKPLQQGNNIALSEYKSVLQAILEKPGDHIKLTHQRVLSGSEMAVFDAEIFSAFYYKQQQVNSGELFALASQYQQTAKLDIAILELLIGHLQQGTLPEKKVEITLSRLTFTDNYGMEQIIATIKDSKLAPRLAIGVPETAILGNISKAKVWFEQLSALGCSICINRFGASMESMHYLLDLSPDQVKLLPAFTYNIDKKQTNAEMVGAFVRMVHGLDITVIAQCIETEQELRTLQKLNIDALLGYAIGKPIPLQLH